MIDLPTRRRRIAAEAAVWSTFGIGLCLLGAVTVTTLRSARELGDALDEAARARAIVTASTRVLSESRKAQSERRAFLLTGDPYFLGLNDSMLAATRQGLAELDTLTRSDPAQHGHVLRIRALLASADSLGQRAIAERRERGVEAAAAFVRSRQGHALVARIEGDVGAIERMQQRALTDALSRAQAAARRANRVAVVASILAVLMVAGAVVVIRSDIGHRRDRSRQLKEATESAHAATQAKSEFLASMSHEIRTPLNGVIGMTELALQTDLSPVQREYLTTAHSSAEALLRLINDILDFSKIEAGRLDLESVPFSIRALLGDTLRSLGVSASQKHLALSHRVHPDVPEAMIGDPGRLQQVVINLVGNAIKFTDRGSIVVSVEAREAGPSHVEIHASVRDTGIGIPKERQQAVFELFTQADSSTTRRFGGTGLGLTISERLVKLMGGRIWVESEAGIGSTFHFTARLGVAPAGVALPSSVPASQGSWRGARVLVVEDNEVNQRVARGMLEKRGLDVTIAGNGVEALEALAAAKPFRLVFMDVEMPRMDGLAATRSQRVRERETGQPRVPIVALTAHALAADHQRCLEAGMDHCLTKPLRANELDAALQRYLGAPDAATAAPAAGAALPGDDDERRLAATLEIVDGDRDLLRTVAGHYARQTPQLIADLRDAVSARDAGRVARIAHTIKGSSLQLGAPEVAAPAASLEDEARSGRLDHGAARLGEIDDAARDFLGFLERSMTATTV